MSAAFSPAALEQFDRILSRYPSREAALLPVLWLAQREFGSLSLDVMKYVAELLSLSPVKVYSVAHFYTMYRKKPAGRHHLQVCHNLSCSLLGAEHLIEWLEKKLGIRAGETTTDGHFTLSRVECLGSCGTAPVIMVNDAYHENLTKEKLERLLASLC